MALVKNKSGNRELIKSDKQKILTKELSKLLKDYGIKLKNPLSSQGSMSFIYKAKDKKGKKLIVKCVIVDKNFDPDQVSRATRGIESDNRKAFETEYSVLSMLKGTEYCVQLYNEAQYKGYHTVGNEDYIVVGMTDRYYACCLIETQYNRFIEGYLRDNDVGYDVPNFSEIINKWSEIYSADCVAAWIGLCISRCICDMKKKDIGFHRDIKPSNILVDTGDGKNMFSGRFVLADFGIAYLNSSNDENNRNARVGTKVFRPANEFMAHDWRDDQYMLGKTLCEYYGVLKPDKRGYLVLEDDELWGESFSDNKYGIRDIIFKMIKDEPVERYQSPEELASAFESALKKINGGKYASLIPDYGNASADISYRTIDAINFPWRMPGVKNEDEMPVKIKSDEEDEEKNPNKETEAEEKNQNKENEEYIQFQEYIKEIFGEPPPPPEPVETGLTIERRMKAIASHLSNGEIKEARTLLKENGRNGKQYIVDRLDGICCYFEGNTEQAKKCFESAQNIDMVSAYFCFVLGNSKVKRFAILQDLFQKMNSDNPLYPAVCYNLYNLYRDSEFVKKNSRTIRKYKAKISTKKLIADMWK